MLVEGPSDEAVLGPHVDPQYCTVMIGHSKLTASGVVDMADSQTLSRVFALLDRDWDGELMPTSESPNVIYTDHYDLDITLILSGSVMRRLLSNVADSAKIRTHLVAIDETSARGLLVQLTSVVGVLRHVSINHGHDLRMRSR